MFRNKVYRGHALIIDLEIMILSLVLLAGGAGAATEIENTSRIGCALKAIEWW